MDQVVAEAGDNVADIALELAAAEADTVVGVVGRL